MVRRKRTLGSLPFRGVFFSRTILSLLSNTVIAGHFYEHADIGDNAYIKVLNENKESKFVKILKEYGFTKSIFNGNFIANEPSDQAFSQFKHSNSKYTEYIIVPHNIKLNKSELTISYGSLNAVSGDHSHDPVELLNDINNKNSRVSILVDLMRKKDWHDIDKESMLLIDQDNQFLDLAYNNQSHFYKYGEQFEGHFADDVNLPFFNNDAPKLAQIGKYTAELHKYNVILTYAVFHMWALKYAHAAGLKIENKNLSKNYLYMSVILNAFADHFLQDCFSAGHLVVGPKITDNIIRDALTVKRIHDIFGVIGVDVVNFDGEEWKAFGDSRMHFIENDINHLLDSDKSSFNMAINATIISLREVMDAFENGIDGISPVS